MALRQHQNGKLLYSSLMNTKQRLSDADILKTSQSYPWMFAVLVDRYEKAFLRRSRSLLSSLDDAEDAVQETFIRIYKYADKFSERDGASFKSWAYRILTNVCLTEAKRRANHQDKLRVMDSADLDVLGGTPESSGLDRASFVESVLRRLPDGPARLLRLFFFEDRTYEDIARIEEMSLSAVRSGLHRAKKQFKKIAIELN